MIWWAATLLRPGVEHFQAAAASTAAAPTLFSPLGETAGAPDGLARFGIVGVGTGAGASERRIGIVGGFAAAGATGDVGVAARAVAARCGGPPCSAGAAAGGAASRIAFARSVACARSVADADHCSRSSQNGLLRSTRRLPRDGGRKRRNGESLAVSSVDAAADGAGRGVEGESRAVSSSSGRWWAPPT